MNYEQIKQKYASATAARRAQIQVAEARIEALTEAIHIAEQEREQFRQVGNEVNHDKISSWWRATSYIESLEKKLDDARMKLADITLGENGIKNLLNI